MTLAIRKVIVASAILVVLLQANMVALVCWLERAGVIAWVQHVREEFLTGTAITVVLALIVLLVPPTVWLAIRKCHVCEALLIRRGKYCPVCGSRT
ncbi:MAG: hypothetical protein AMXMBFR16_12030 [Candidatus Uhrbacteria bacterium]